MHPNPTSGVHGTFTFTTREIKHTITTPASRARRANVPPTTPEVVLSMKEVTEIGSGCNFCRSGNHTHADVNVSPVHTDVKVKTAGGFAGASPAESRCRLRNRYERLPPPPVASLPVGESTCRGVFFDIIRHWSLRVNPRMGTPIRKRSHWFWVSATAGESV